MSIGEVIKEERTKAKLTQQQLANKIGVTQSMVAQLERGTRTLTINLAMEIAKVLNKDLSIFDLSIFEE